MSRPGISGDDRLTEEPHIADPQPHPDDDVSGVGQDRGSTTSTPRWVKALVKALAVIVVIGVFVLIIVLHATGQMGPGVHS